MVKKCKPQFSNAIFFFINLRFTLIMWHKYMNTHIHRWFTEESKVSAWQKSVLNSIYFFSLNLLPPSFHRTEVFVRCGRFYSPRGFRSHRFENASIVFRPNWRRASTDESALVHSPSPFTPPPFPRYKINGTLV